MTIFNSDRYNLFTQFQETGNRLSSKILFSWPISYGPSSNLEESFGQCWKVFLLNVEKFFILISLRPSILTSQNYFNNKFASQNLSWENIYVPPRQVTLGAHMRFFSVYNFQQYLYLNERFFVWEIFFCLLSDSFTETCKNLYPWYTITDCNFVFHDNDNDSIVRNHILLFFMIYLYMD